jgi:uncharacterized protein (DUF427 family)
MPDPGPGHRPDPAADKAVEIADFDGRVRTAVCGIVIADSENAKILRETGYDPVVYFPPDDVRTAEFMTRTDKRTTCPKKGEAGYWSFRLGDHEEPDIAWSYADPLPACAAIKDHVAFYWDRMDVWFAGDRPLAGPPA